MRACLNYTALKGERAKSKAVVKITTFVFLIYSQYFTKLRPSKEDGIDAREEKRLNNF